jgi:uncharacterized protein (TIGR03083 family)
MLNLLVAWPNRATAIPCDQGQIPSGCRSGALCSVTLRRACRPVAHTQGEGLTRRDRPFILNCALLSSGTCAATHLGRSPIEEAGSSPADARVENGAMDDTHVRELIQSARAETADTLAGLSDEQWAAPSLCGGWSVQDAAGHIVVGGEQTPARFAKHMVTNLFRFNTMVDRDARRVGARPPAEIIERLRATTSTTNRPPAPVMTMLGEVIVHSEDIRSAVGLPGHADSEAVAACLEISPGRTFRSGPRSGSPVSTS